MFKIFAEAYGCSSNFADYEIALGLLKEAGFEFVKDSKKSDLNIIFTCTVKVPTAQRMIHRITELTKTKKPLIVAGCMPKTERRIIEKINPNASMLGPDSIEKIVDVVKTALKKRKIIFTEDLRKPKLCLPRVRRNPVIGIIPISIGCLNNCSYCSVKFARGILFSYPIQDITKEVRQAVKAGCKEFYLTSQDNGCYGFDIGTTLHELISEVCKMEGKFFVRVGMMNPLHTKQFLGKLIESYKNEKIFKFLHIPVQSGSNRILELMNRGYKVEDFLDIAEKFRKEFSKLTLATDIIVGFPSETEEDFNKTMKLIEKIKPDIINISKFGARLGTMAAKMKQLPTQIVNRRSKELFELERKIALEKNKKWIDCEGEILIDEIGRINHTWIGRNFAYKPVVVSSKEKLLGKFVNVKIIGAKSNYLLGEIK